MIEVQNVSRIYSRGADTVYALSDVSLTIASSRFVAIMGPSGSGKSTLLNLIAGLDRPDKGEVIVEGQRLSRFSEDGLADWRNRRVGLVFQFYNLLPVLNAVENVELPLLLTKLRRPERRRRALVALKAVNLADRGDHLPAELSGGEQQRVAIARAIVADPAFILADEPTGDLDARSAEDMLVLLRELNRAFQKTIVMVTHDARARGHVDDVIYLDKGILTNGGAG